MPIIGYVLHPAPSSPSPRDPALPGWITPDLIAQTLAVWQPFYPEPLSHEDAVEMLLTVGNLYRILAAEAPTMSSSSSNNSSDPRPIPTASNRAKTRRDPSTSAMPKRYVALARVSSRAQEAEGYSLEAQAEALHAYAAKQGGTVVRLWKIAETASKSDRRTSFKELLAYAKANAKELDGLLVFKVDRAARNMADYGRLLDLEVSHGVPLIAIGQPTPDTPAGRMARNMMAAMGTFFAEQLALDVRDGLARRVRDGWFPTVAPYGYVSQRVDGRSVVKVEPREADNVRRIFHLYAYDNCTVDMVLDRLTAEARTYTAKQPAWQRSKVHRVLRDRSYIGDIRWHDQWVPGRHEPFVDRTTFERVQVLLGDKVYQAHELVYGGERITCVHCGRPVTGELVAKKSGKVYVYYRCSKYTAPGHPRERVREQDIDREIVALFARIRQPEPVAAWFRQTLIAATTHEQEQSRARASDLQRQLDEVRRQQERLLNLHLGGGVDEPTFLAKNTELRDRLAKLTLELQACDRRGQERADHVLRVFELSQSLPQRWDRADCAEKRRILDMVCLNLSLGSGSVAISTSVKEQATLDGRTRI